MKLYITRHGQTEWNALKKVMGRCDEPLNEVGIKQAYETKNILAAKEIDLIICSPLKRAMQTAQIINEEKNIPIIYDDRIIERDFGEFEGLKTSDFNFFGYWNYCMNGQYEKAENIQKFFERVYLFLDDIKEKYSDKNVLLVTHGGVSLPVECYFKGSIPSISLIEAGLVLANCDVREYNVENKKVYSKK